VVDIKALHFYLSLFFFHSINLVTKLIFSLILNKINNPRGNDLVFACYTIVLILCTCELKRTNYYLLI
jgi:hypothetical protein